MIVARYIGELGALPSRSTGGGARTLNLRKNPTPAPVKAIAAGRALRAPTPARPAPTVANVTRVAPAITQRPPTLNKPKRPAPSSSSSSPSPAPAPIAAEVYAPPASASSSSSGSSAPFFDATPIGSGELPVEQLPIKDAYVSVSGGIPDGAFYAIMAAAAVGVGFVLWKRSKRK